MMFRKLIGYHLVLLNLLWPLVRSDAAEVEKFPLVTTYPIGHALQSIVAGDFNRDGVVDLAVTQGPGRTISVLLGDGKGTFSAPKTYAVNNLLTGNLAAGDFNRDGILDLMVLNNGGHNVAIMFGNGEGGFSPGKIVALVGTPESAVTVDFNHDGKLDIAVVRDTPTDPSVSVILGDGKGNFSEATNFTFTVGEPRAKSHGEYRGPRHMVTADFNRDGNPDLAITLQHADHVALLLGDGNGRFSDPKGIPLPPGSQPRSMTVGDFNIDGTPDLAVGTTGKGFNIHIFLGNGKGEFTLHGTITGQVDHWSLITGDFNVDGRPDFAAQSLDSKVSIFYGYGDGTFTTPMVVPTVGRPTDEFYRTLVSDDFNNDGYPDIATISDAPSLVAVILNRMGQKGTGVTPSVEYYKRKRPIQVSHLSVNPGNPRIIYLATINQGMYRSTDGGENWRAVNTNIKNYLIYSMAVHPTDPRIVYIGTWGGGIYKTENGGESWREINEGLTHTAVSSVIIDPENPQILYACTSMQVFQSTDTGEHWSPLEVQPGMVLSDNVYYVRTLMVLPSSPSTLLLGSDLGLFQWIEKDQRWEKVATIEARFIRAQTYDKRTNTAYVVSDDGIYISRDYGKTWSAWGHEKIVAHSIVISPTQPNVAYLLTLSDGILKTTDGGNSWKAVNDGINDETRAIAVDPAHPETLYTGTYSKGVFITNDGGTTWNAAKNIELQSIEDSLAAITSIEGFSDVIKPPPPEFAKCNQCHGWTDPNLRFFRKSWWQMAPTRREWALTVQRMGVRAGLTPQETANVLKYMNTYYGLQKKD